MIQVMRLFFGCFLLRRGRGGGGTRMEIGIAFWSKSITCWHSNLNLMGEFLAGGPLLFTDRSQQNQLLYQVGITSYGQYCGVMPSVSTRVTSYLEWITSVTPYANYCIQWNILRGGLYLKTRSTASAEKKYAIYTLYSKLTFFCCQAHA